MFIFFYELGNITLFFTKLIDIIISDQALWRKEVLMMLELYQQMAADNFIREQFTEPSWFVNGEASSTAMRPAAKEQAVQTTSDTPGDRRIFRHALRIEAEID